MNALSHIHLSLIIKKAVEKELRVKLNTLSFIIGSLKPDFSYMLLKIPHYRIPSPEIITRELQKLNRQLSALEAMTVREFSQKVAIINHYLTDFFCHTHSVRFSGSVADHYLYEQKLWNYRRKIRKELKGMATELTSEARKTDSLHFGSLLDHLNHQYHSSKPSFYLDLSYALRAGMSMVYALTSAYVMPPVDQVLATKLKPVV